MESRVLPAADVVAILSAKFICLKVDADNPGPAEKFLSQVKGNMLPFYAYATPDGKFISGTRGFRRDEGAGPLQIGREGVGFQSGEALLRAGREGLQGCRPVRGAGRVQAEGVGALRDDQAEGNARRRLVSHPEHPASRGQRRV